MVYEFGLDHGLNCCSVYSGEECSPRCRPEREQSIDDMPCLGVEG